MNTAISINGEEHVPARTFEQRLKAVEEVVRSLGEQRAASTPITPDTRPVADFEKWDGWFGVVKNPWIRPGAYRKRGEIWTGFYIDEPERFTFPDAPAQLLVVDEQITPDAAAELLGKAFRVVRNDKAENIIPAGATVTVEIANPEVTEDELTRSLDHDFRRYSAGTIARELLSRFNITRKGPKP